LEELRKHTQKKAQIYAGCGSVTAHFLALILNEKKHVFE